LGLAICREIVAAHSGQIFARNRKRDNGGGAEFIVRLLVDRRALRGRQAASSAEVHARINKRPEAEQ
jgi:K+-sensing histidine kinase KdpD